MPRKSSTAAQQARQAARAGAKYTTALRHYSDREDAGAAEAELEPGEITAIERRLMGIPELTEAERERQAPGEITAIERRLMGVPELLRAEWWRARDVP
jgi:hypothetical protein